MPVYSLRRPALFLPLFAALCIPSMAPAADPAYLGEANCRIAPLQPVPRGGEVSWKGSCADGFAQGTGVLTWRDASNVQYSLQAVLERGDITGEGELKTDRYTYQGTFRHGTPHGSGFYRHRSGAMYEGELIDGKANGQGIHVAPDGSKYTGEWKDDTAHGWGEHTFALGGSYRGHWRDGKFHGHGTLVHGGSARVHEGEFEAGRIAGTPVPVLEKDEFPLIDRNYSYTKPLATGILPLDAGWDRLTEAQRNTWREQYPALAPGDDPPYPLNGPRATFKAISEMVGVLGLVKGDMRIYVLVGADGKAKRAEVYEKPELFPGADMNSVVRYAAGVMMLDTYKPASCDGRPCEMIYPVLYGFKE